MSDPVSNRHEPDDGAVRETDCRDRALRLLERRPHSRRELRRKLVRRAFPEAVIETVLDDLERVHLLDDEQFARLFCEERMRGSRALGGARLRAELRRRGVADDVADAVLSELAAEGELPSELERAVAAARRKASGFGADGDPWKDRGRLLRFLARRGFPAGICREAADRVLPLP